MVLSATTVGSAITWVFELLPLVMVRTGAKVLSSYSCTLRQPANQQDLQALYSLLRERLRLNVSAIASITKIRKTAAASLIDAPDLPNV